MAKKAELSEEEEKCSIALDVALEETFVVCGGEEGKKRLFCEMGALLGLATDDAAELSPHCALILDDFEDKNKRKDVCSGPGSFKSIRAVVMCNCWRLIEEDHLSFKKAINTSWAWAKDKCRDVGAHI